MMNAMKKALFLVILSVVVNGKLAFNEVDDDVITSEDVIENIMNLKVRRKDRQPTIAKRSVHGECNDQLKFPEDPNIVIIDGIKKIDYRKDFDMTTYCQPQKFSVKIPVLSHVNIHPVNVDLKRCSGSPHTIAQDCVAFKKQKVKVTYYDVTNKKSETAEMWEHIECKSECVKKKEHCNALEIYNDNKCECHCGYDKNTYKCTNSKKTFSRSKCACVCVTIKSCMLYKEFSPDTCECECSKCIKDMCRKKGLVLDTNLCRCVKS